MCGSTTCTPVCTAERIAGKEGTVQRSRGRATQCRALPPVQNLHARLRRTQCEPRSDIRSKHRADRQQLGVMPVLTPSAECDSASCITSMHTHAKEACRDNTTLRWYTLHYRNIPCVHCHTCRAAEDLRIWRGFDYMTCMCFCDHEIAQACPRSGACRACSSSPMILYCTFCMRTPAIRTPQQCSAPAQIGNKGGSSSAVLSVMLVMHCRKCLS